MAQIDFPPFAQKSKNTAHVCNLGGVYIRAYVDEGKTGTNLERPAFQELLKDARDGKFDIVVVTYMSRLARGPAFYVAEYCHRRL